ncbi:hypothetical protein Sjap_002625 [Stephania japonica]|uniref:Uncharacterized protein n=1 Tax=Stephania japonica TaxID=461633 RepID=A0AAP0KPU7_9MAGN
MVKVTKNLSKTIVPTDYVKVKEKAKVPVVAHDRPKKSQKFLVGMRNTTLGKGSPTDLEKGKPTKFSMRLKISGMLKRAKLPPNTYDTPHVIKDNKGQSKVKTKGSTFISLRGARSPLTWSVLHPLLP